METNPPAAATSEVLTQAEVERLLAQVAEQESKATIVKSDGAKEARNKDSLQPYDFRNPALLDPPELRRLRAEHEQYATRVAALLSIYLRIEFTLKVTQIQTLSYSQLTESIANPAHIVLFKVEPLRGICLLDVNPRLGLTIADRLMGGAGQAPQVSNELSEIESALLDQPIQNFLSEWCSHWRKALELKPVIIGHENSGQFLQTAHADTTMLVITLEAHISDCTESLRFAFPFATIEPLMRALSANSDLEPVLAPAPQVVSRWNPSLENASIPVTAEWPTLEMTARDLTNLKVGDVLPLEPEVVNNVQLRLASLPKFAGRLGTKGSKWAVEITQTFRR